MKCFAAVLFFALLTEKSFATECCSNNTLDVTPLLKTYQSVLDNIIIPPIEYGDQSSGEFKNKTGQAIQTYGLTLLDNIHSQAQHLGDELIKNIQRAYDKVKRTIRLIPRSHRKRIALEKSIRKLTDQCWKFLELKPGNETICNPPVLSDVPVLPLKLNSEPKKNSAKDIFLKGESTIYNMTLQIYGWMAYVFQTIIAESRPVYEFVRQQINDEILNCSVMGTYKKIVIKILRQACLIRLHISPDTWEYFQDAADRILDISKSYCKALKDRETVNATISLSTDTQDEH